MSQLKKLPLLNKYFPYYDFVSDEKNRIVITIGESWTWGDHLGNSNWSDKVDNKKFRLNNVYGGRLALKLDADFLNIALPGASNLWIAQQYQQLLGVIDQLDYDKIYVVLTLTEVGREFQSDLDRDRNYVHDLKEIKSINEFIFCLSKYIEQEITSDSRVQLVVGTNFVDSSYKVIEVLPKSWIDLIAEQLQIELVKPCYVVGSWVISRYLDLLDFTKDFNKTFYLKESLDLMALADTRTDFLLASPFNYKTGSKHPTPEGHQLWAEYLYNNINEKI